MTPLFGAGEREDCSFLWVNPQGLNVGQRYPLAPQMTGRSLGSACTQMLGTKI